MAVDGLWHGCSVCKAPWQAVKLVMKLHIGLATYELTFCFSLRQVSPLAGAIEEMMSLRCWWMHLWWCS